MRRPRGRRHCHARQTGVVVFDLHDSAAARHRPAPPMTSEMRVRAANDAPIASAGRYVLYWMIAARRAGSNFALDRAIAQARRLRRPLLVLEALRLDYPWASARVHQFVLDGMLDNARAFDQPGVRYLPYLEPTLRSRGRTARGAGRRRRHGRHRRLPRVLPAADGDARGHSPPRATRGRGRQRPAADGRRRPCLPDRVFDAPAPSADARCAPRRRAGDRSVRGRRSWRAAGPAGGRGCAMARRLHLARARRTPVAVADRARRGPHWPARRRRRGACPARGVRRIRSRPLRRRSE